MPQLAKVVLTDSADVKHDFNPNDITGGVATLVDSSSAIPLGEARLTIGRTQTAAGRRKVTFKLAVPVVQDSVINGVSRPTVLRTAYANIEMSFDGTSTKAERATLRDYVATLFFREQAMSDGPVVQNQGLY